MEQERGTGGTWRMDGRLWPLYTLETAVFLLSATLVGMLFRKIGFKETNVVLFIYPGRIYHPPASPEAISGEFWPSVAATLPSIIFHKAFTIPFSFMMRAIWLPLRS